MEDAPATKDIVIPIPPIDHPPAHIGGDREFAGHGPDIHIVTTLMKQGDYELIVEIYMDAVETKPDWTHFQGTKLQIVYNAEEDHPGWMIQRILSDTTSSLAFRDTGHGKKLHPPDNGKLVRMYRVQGDQKGEDQPWVQVIFNDVLVRLVETPMQFRNRQTQTTTKAK
jgi:hypothetical protein